MDTTGRSSAWRLRAEEHARAASDVWRGGIRAMADPTTGVGPSRDVYHQEVDHLYDRMSPHQLRARRYAERAAAFDEGKFLQHPDDQEMHEFLSDSHNAESWRLAASEGRLKVLKKDQLYSLPGENRA